MTVWNFSTAGDRMAALFGPGRMAPVNNGAWTSTLLVGSASSFKLPVLPGGDANVMYIPALTPRQGLRVTFNTPVRGPYDGEIAEYTLIWDALWPRESDGYARALYQTSPDNADDANLYVNADRGVGFHLFDGTVTPNVWHRIAVVVRADDEEGQMEKFIDGRSVGTEVGIGYPWSVYRSILLFTDSAGYTAPVYVSGFAVVGEALSAENITALGKAAAGGPHIPGK
jgi:hypothetical protein